MTMRVAARFDFGDRYQAAVLGQVLHSCDESRNRTLLAKVHRALAPGVTLPIAEFVVDEARASQTNALTFAVKMLVNAKDGDTNSFAEITGWLKEVGFGNVRIITPPGPAPLFLADRAL